jgi:hypothetical protein
VIDSSLQAHTIRAKARKARGSPQVQDVFAIKHEFESNSSRYGIRERNGGRGKEI